MNSLGSLDIAATKARISGAVDVQSAAISQIVDAVAAGLLKPDRTGPVVTIFLNASLVSGADAGEIARLLADEILGADSFLALDMGSVDAYSHVYHAFCALIEGLRKRPARVVYVCNVDLSDGRVCGLINDVLEASHQRTEPRSPTQVTLSQSVVIVVGDRFPVSTLASRFDLLLMLRPRPLTAYRVSPVRPIQASRDSGAVASDASDVWSALDLALAQANLRKFQNGFPAIEVAGSLEHVSASAAGLCHQGDKS